MSHHATEASRTRRQTGVVGLIFDGDRPPPISSEEILERARQTEFVVDARFTSEYEGGRVEYVPAAMSDDAVLDTIAYGRVVFRFTVVGDAPDATKTLRPATYYTFVDFVEGPDFDEGRWIARIVSEDGEVVGLVPGVEVKQVFSFHMDEHERDRHGRPEMHVHGLGIGEVNQVLFRRFTPPKSTDSWVVTSGSWQPYGNGCMRTFYCTPAPVVAILRA
jgi:hypothetical protein